MAMLYIYEKKVIEYKNVLYIQAKTLAMNDCKRRVLLHDSLYTNVIDQCKGFQFCGLGGGLQAYMFALTAFTL